MKNPQSNPDDFAPLSASGFANSVGLRPSIVYELIERKELQHFVDHQGKLRIWTNVSRWCKHPETGIDWSSPSSGSEKPEDEDTKGQCSD
jgi:hypothetical protein